MIGWLRGEVVRASGDGKLVIDVQGVGYEVNVAMVNPPSYALGDNVILHVHTHVRDDAIVLYAFSNFDERQTFELLLSTPGVGPSTALGALATFSPQELATAIALEDVSALATIPGIGKKTAARLVLELSGKLPTLLESEVNSSVSTSLSGDLEVALQGFGYSVSEIRSALKGVTMPSDESAALRLALQYLGSR